MNEKEHPPRLLTLRCIEKWAFAAVVLTAAALILNQSWPGTSVADTPSLGQAAHIQPSAMVQEEAGPQILSNAFRAAAHRVLPAVVEIKDDGGPSAIWPDRLPGAFGEPEFTPFSNWSEFSPETRDLSQSPEAAVASGILIDPSGIVLTNRHVVHELRRPVVHLADGRRFEARDVRTDAESDLAILHIDSPVPLPAAHLGDSSRLQIGDWILTVGSPLDLRQTVSAGIVSATGRKLDEAANARLLQTDAAINPGSSGGALVDLRGELVGVTTAIASRDGGYQGIGFAIPSNIAKWVVKQLTEYGEVRRSTIGITTASTLPPPQEGVVPQLPTVKVTHVANGSTGEQAGLRPDDVIVAFDGTKIHDVDLLEEIIQQQEVGSQHRLEIVRDGIQRTVEVATERRTPSPTRDPNHPWDGAGPTEVVYSRDLQLEVAAPPVSSNSPANEESSQGVLVVQTDPAGPAHRAGVRKGMRIRQVDKRPVHDLDSFIELMERASLTKGIDLVLQTDDGLRRIHVKRN